MNFPKNTQPLATLVLGGNGKTGRKVAERLSKLNVPVRIGSRSGNPRFDWMEESTWRPALKGMDAVYVTFQPDLTIPEAQPLIEAFARTAVQSGIKKLVFLSGRGEKEAQMCESLIINCGAPWTIVRCSWFNQNLSESFLVEPIQSGVVALPVGNVGEPFVDTDDVADVVVAALTEQGHDGQVYELTGPRLLTYAQVVGEIAQATGRDIRFIQVTPEEYAEELKAAQVPPEFIDLILHLFTEVMDGRNASLTDGVQRALGRQPKDFSTFVTETVGTGVWKG
ncbi:MAG: NAD(P)H-binding protein [Chitinophagaceae bacterium]|nr:NAD(P)H-binding protein [Chitinophagaceae bacterium]